MKDPKRIKRILKLIEKIWEKCPDLRLCQLIKNAISETDVYYVEDDRLEELLKRVYSDVL